jgi:hypothetical protein
MGALIDSLNARVTAWYVESELTVMFRTLDERPLVCEPHRGDDLERARWAFQHRTPEQMQELWGQSGRTCQQVLDEYQQHANAVSAALAWVDAQP